MAKNEIILTIGPSGSGKTSFTTEFIKNNPDYVRISRDGFRLMMQDVKFMDQKGESMVTKMLQNAIIEAIRGGYNVILEQTNLDKDRLEKCVEWARYYGDVYFWVFDVDEDTLVKRNQARKDPIPDKALKKQLGQFSMLMDSNFNFNMRPKKEGQEVIYDEDPNLPHCVIFDVDGTLAKMQNRGPFDWDHVDHDRPNWPIVKLCRELKEQGNTIVIFTGRDGIAYDKTVEWLNYYEIPYDELYIRPKNNFEKDSVIKQRMFNDNIRGRYYVDFVVDDRDQVVEMWRDKMGLTCIQVDKGNF